MLRSGRKRGFDGSVEDTSGYLIHGCPKITFSFELEFVLAFHESLLRPLIDEEKGFRIAKDLDLDQRHGLNLADWSYEYFGRYEYMSWAVRGEYSKRRFTGKINEKGGPRYLEPDLRSYWREPLKITRDILKDVEPKLVMHYPRWDKLQAYVSWSVMNDHSVQGYSRERLLKTFADRIAPGRENVWDSWGLELVSPVFNSHEDPFPGVEKVLSALKGDAGSLHGAGTTFFAGHHVHIGLPLTDWSSRTKLSTYQHLGYITLLYEPIVSSLHPSHRRPYTRPRRPTYTDLRPNRQSLDTGYHDPELGMYYLANRAKYGDQYSYQPPDMLTLDETRRKIWEDGMTIKGLAEFLCFQKDFVINWENVRTGLFSTGAETIEFRQHPSTLDPAEIRHWTLFLLALVRAAYVKAMMPTPGSGPPPPPQTVATRQPTREEPTWVIESRKYGDDITKWPEAGNEDAVDKLFKLLRLDPTEERYWRARYEKFLVTDISEERSHQRRWQGWKSAKDAAENEESGHWEEEDEGEGEEEGEEEGEDERE